MSVDIDSIDRTILRILQENGRTTLTEIAQRLGMTRTAVRFRLRDMERDGVVKGYTVWLDPLKFDSAVYVQIWMEVKPPNIPVCIRSLRDFKEIMELHRLSGTRTLCAIAFFRNPHTVTTSY